MNYSLLPHRGILRVSGEDKASFLQGIVSNDMRLVASDRLVYSCFLTPQGKYLADFFVLQYGEDWLIDVDASLLSDLMRRLTMYKLRSKVTLTDASADFNVYAFWGKGEIGLPVLPDPRLDVLGTRGYFPKDYALHFDDTTHQGDYMLWRIQNGVSDVADFDRERSSMAEGNLDLLNAISWDKGCYMGQELTARVHYRGLVKKRLVPLRTVDAITSLRDTPIKQGEKTIGHLRSTHQNYALALVTLDVLNASESVSIDGQIAEILMPEWLGAE